MALNIACECAVEMRANRPIWITFQHDLICEDCIDAAMEDRWETPVMRLPKKAINELANRLEFDGFIVIDAIKFEAEVRGGVNGDG